MLSHTKHESRHASVKVPKRLQLIRKLESYRLLSTSRALSHLPIFSRLSFSSSYTAGLGRRLHEESAQCGRRGERELDGCCTDSTNTATTMQLAIGKRLCVCRHKGA